MKEEQEGRWRRGMRGEWRAVQGGPGERHAPSPPQQGQRGLVVIILTHDCRLTVTALCGVLDVPVTIHL